MLGTLSGFTSMVNLVKLGERRKSIVRVYLLKNMQVVRLETSKGGQMDLPLSAMTLNRFESRTGTLVVKLNDKIWQLKLKQASYSDPALLYACFNTGVSQIQAATANASQ